jgi:hypothetical protein
MNAWRIWLASAAIVCSSTNAQDLPTHEGEEPLEIEPPLLIQSRAADGSLVLSGAAAQAPLDGDLEKLERDLTRAKRNAAGADRQYKAGIISKVEAEERVLKVIRLEAKLAEARLHLVKQLAEGARSNETSFETVANSEDASVAEAAAVAERAAEERRRAELEAALRNLQRQQKLLALGSGRKADVNRAEQKLAELQRAHE